MDVIIVPVDHRLVVVPAMTVVAPLVVHVDAVIRAIDHDFVMPMTIVIVVRVRFATVVDMNIVITAIDDRLVLVPVMVVVSPLVIHVHSVV